MEYSLYNVYKNIYRGKFSCSDFINTISGHIYSKDVYLNIDDLKMMDDLYNIVDFYKKIQKTGNVYMLKISDIYQSNFCKHYLDNYNMYCIDCDEYVCLDCVLLHSSHSIEKCKYTKVIFDDYCDYCRKTTPQPQAESSSADDASDPERPLPRFAAASLLAASTACEPACRGPPRHRRRTKKTG
jgi:hypothetical protein